MVLPAGSFVAETEVKRSRFIAHLVPYEEFDAIRRRLREEHPKANHIVYAWRHINEYEQCLERCDDDGEPKGCAGSPILTVMRGAALVETAILVVRYFGGIKLGTGGMARAYAAAARTVIAEAELLPWQRRERFTFRSGYGAQRQLLYLLERLGIRPKCRFEGAGIFWELDAPAEAIEDFRREADRLIEPCAT